MIVAVLFALSTGTPTAYPPTSKDAETANRRCPASHRLLLGNWSMDGIDRTPSEIFPNGDSRAWQFAIEEGRPIWREWMHFRPGGDGQWALRGCRVSIIHRDTPREDYDVIRLTRTQLWVRAVGDRNIERWTRIVN